jgi:maleylacetate reductase
MRFPAFNYTALPGRVLFGAGRIAELGAEVERIGANRLLILATPGRASLADRAAVQLGPKCAAIFAEAAMHTPVAVTQRALALVEELGIDGLIAIGGGSAIGLSKAIALRTDLPQIAIPTTYAGSEMTPVVGQTSDGQKVTQASPRILPEVVIYDAELTLDMPVGLSGLSGINAIAHAVEALYARDRNPVTSLMATEAVRSMIQALDRIAEAPRDIEARAAAQYGAWLGGTCLGAVGMALHHKICHVLGGAIGLPHAETHAVLLPHTLSYNAPAAPDAMALLRDAVGGGDPARVLFDLGRRIGAPAGLKELGMEESQIGLVVERTLASPYWNPRELEAGALQAMLHRAWNGNPPEA